jgi:hypothetical protein
MSNCGESITTNLGDKENRNLKNAEQRRTGVDKDAENLNSSRSDKFRDYGGVTDIPDSERFDQAFSTNRERGPDLGQISNPQQKNQ